jgi:uncharacterized protein YjbI with pentapeptide repeats
MRLFTLLLFASLAATSLEAASYVQNVGTIVNPILDVTGVVHSYSGDNLEPLVDAHGADLTGARLSGPFGSANDIVDESNSSESQFLSASSVQAVLLSGHNMSGWDLSGLDLQQSNLYGADLTDAVLANANLTRVNLVFSNITEGQFLSGSSVMGVQLRLSVENV